eukprot:12947138-Ditylum_brightwellii.AAC.1
MEDFCHVIGDDGLVVVLSFHSTGGGEEGVAVIGDQCKPLCGYKQQHTKRRTNIASANKLLFLLITSAMTRQ